MKRKILAFILAFFLVLTLSMMLIGCSRKVSLEKGATVEENILTDKEYGLPEIAHPEAMTTAGNIAETRIPTMILLY